jgi:hypothetical protein
VAALETRLDLVHPQQFGRRESLVGDERETAIRP